MQKTVEDVGFLQPNRAESEVFEGAHTFIWIVGERIVGVQICTHNLLELSLSLVITTSVSVLIVVFMMP